MPRHTGCASLEQASTKEARLEETRGREPQHPQENVPWVSLAPSGGAQPRPASRIPAPALGGAPHRQRQAMGRAGTSQPKSLQLQGK